MDTLFRLVNLQSDQYSYNSTSRTSSSSRSSKHHHQDCYDLYMDEDDFSSSSSRHFYPAYQHQQLSNTPTPTNTSTNTSVNTSSAAAHHVFDSTPDHGIHGAGTADPHHQFSFCPDPSLTHFASTASGKWAAELLMQCARAFADKNTAHVQQYMWMLNELGSPYGDTDQKLASYFLQALFSRVTDSGRRCHRTLTSASDKTCSFESTRKMLLKFQEVSPWTTFGHVACNGAILEAFDGEARLHIVDMSTSFCTQWPTLLEALATRSDDTPHLRITTVVPNRSGDGSGTSAAVHKVMREIGNRMEKFARLMGVPFKFNVVYYAGDISDINLDELGIKPDETLAVNCVGTLHGISPSGSGRDSMISAIRRMGPKILTIVEDETDMDIGADGHMFVRGFEECVRWFSVYFESLDQSFPRASNERLMLERAAGRALVDLISCPPAESRERRDTAGNWSRRLHGAGLTPVPFSSDVSDDVRALLRRYQEGWSTTSSASSDAGIFLGWKDQPVVWASAWRL